MRALLDLLLAIIALPFALKQQEPDAHEWEAGYGETSVGPTKEIEK